jgi:lipopolysaccharide transport system permease protein
MTSNFDWEIESKSKLIDFKISDVWEYRDLLFLLVRRDFVSFYKQTILGPIWFFLQPFITTVMFTFVFGKLGGFKTDGLPQPLFYMAGVTTWNYFADCLTKTSTVFKDNANLFGKVYFPRLIIPFSIVISNLVKFGVQMTLFILMIIYYIVFTDFNFQLNSFILLFPIIMLMMAFLGLGLGMIISAMTTKYRDLSYLITFGVQLLMYSTTVIYPLSTVNNDARKIIELNPMTSIIETFRFGFLGTATFQLSLFIYSIVFAIGVLFLGIIIFNKVERTFVDTV